MSIAGQRYEFTKDNIQKFAPDFSGVYGLYDRDEVIYYGEGESVMDRLLSHSNGFDGPCTQSATHFNWSLTALHERREKELLRAHEAQAGQLPRCNDRIG
ncbi:MAG: hypothetical protein IIA66_02995 [Planctomycetes bacterium]|nr:hypothetical protein [Planctomycetota bacterium]